MSQRISILRIFGAIAAVTLITGTVTSVIEYRRMDRKFWEWVNARPMSAPVDLSQPGAFTAPFHQTRHGGHGEAFYLNVDPMPPSDYEELLKGLDGTITIKDSADKVVESLAISSSTDIRNPSGAPLMLGVLPPLPVGEYTATIQVKQGASALRGIEQRIHAEHDLCGCENLAFVNAVLAWALVIPGFVIGAFVTIGFFKHGWKTPPKRRPSRWLQG